MIKIRKTEEKDIEIIMTIVNQAQEYFRSQGINQWQNGYPTKDVFTQDICNERSYVVENDGMVVGTFFFAIDKEPTYKKIYEGSWQHNGVYGMIHRVAVDNSMKGNGIGGKIVAFATEQCKKQNIASLRIDTHKDNISMQRMLTKNGFEPRGIIYLEDGAERIGFEKML